MTYSLLLSIEINGGYNPFGNRGYSNAPQFNTIDGRRDDHFISLKKKSIAINNSEKKPLYGVRMNEIDDELENQIHEKP